MFDMPDARMVEWIREKYIDLAAELDERGRRRMKDSCTPNKLAIVRLLPTRRSTASTIRSLRSKE